MQPVFACKFVKKTEQRNVAKNMMNRLSILNLLIQTKRKLTNLHVIFKGMSSKHKRPIW
jgi:hypothetical protein